MPELPEVETVVKTLEVMLQDAQIKDVHVFYPPIVGGKVDEFETALKNQHFNEFKRRGKYLLFYMDDVLLSAHLRMEGKFFVEDSSYTKKKHDHVIFDLVDGRRLVYSDFRKFGRMEVLQKDFDLETFHQLGVEPFDDRFNEAYVYNVCKNRKVPLKTLLLDQSFVAGIGNIYADEILFACKLRPGRSCNRITHKDASNIAMHTKRILQEAILAGGTTIRTYESAKGVHGRFQLSCMVHGLKECKQCGSTIHVKRIGGRSSYYCPHCQK